MKILMLTPYLPYPLFSGGQIRTYNLLKNLSLKHKITLFSFIRKEEEKKFIPYLYHFCYKIEVFKRRSAWDWKNILVSAVTPLPFVMIATYWSFRLRKKIWEELNKENYNLIHAEPFYMMPNIPSKTEIPVLLVEQTIEYLVYKKFVDDFKFFLAKPFMYWDVMKLKFWEEYYWKKANRLVAMSLEDKKIMKRVVPQKKIDIVANGVDIDFFEKTKIKRPLTPTILFVGNFKWLPNKDAATFLAYKVWPLIKKNLPNAKLWIVGKNPTREIRALSNLEGVFINSDIDDIREAFGRASVLLAPIRNGRGTKYKILEAMASRLPVVTTPLGIEGIAAKEGREVLIGKNPSELASLVLKILKQPRFGKKLSENAFSLIKNKYNWQLIASRLDKVYQQVAR